LALQELFQDVLGGVFIMLDKSLQAGDIIEVEGKVGRVVDIRLRTTRAITRDDKVLIIPNHKFISDTVYNYTQNHKQTRETVSVGVAYGSDTTLVKTLLLKSLEKDSRILSRPKPFVLFEDFGDSALMFSVNFFVSDSFTDPVVKSDIRFRIDQLFREHNISIPFPQRDVHLYTRPTQELPKTD
jgi:small-conductance mechanosensitive channel